MTESFAADPLMRTPTGIPGLDRILDGGLLVGGAFLVAGPPGSGKTTLGVQMAFAHAAAGRTAVVATLLAESHDRMLAHLRGFAFFDPAAIGERVHFVSLLPALEEGGLDGVLDATRQIVRERGATLLLIDGTAAAEHLAQSAVAYGGFTQQLQSQSSLLGCTTVLLTNRQAEEVDVVGTHVDGVVLLSRQRIDSRAVRSLEVVKMRGTAHLTGGHDLTISGEGIAVFPRLEAALMDIVPSAMPARERRGFGVPSLDAMLNGGLLPGSSTAVIGTPGAGKTLTGLHFAAEGAHRGERVVIAGFRETPEVLAATADGVGLDLGKQIAAGAVRVLWQPPLELLPDAWAWSVLRAVDEHRPSRLVVDALSDVSQFLGHPERMYTFTVALANALRSRDVTSLVQLEIETVAGPELAIPLPSASAATDNAILLRTVELRSRLHRIVSVLKTRQSAFDPAIREFEISSGGLTVGDVFPSATGLLTGQAQPAPRGGAGTPAGLAKR